MGQWVGLFLSKEEKLMEQKIRITTEQGMVVDVGIEYILSLVDGDKVKSVELKKG